MRLGTERLMRTGDKGVFAPFTTKETANMPRCAGKFGFLRGGGFSRYEEKTQAGITLEGVCK